MSETFFGHQDLVFGIPTKYQDEFKERHGIEPHMDFDIDGDGWKVLAKWVSDLLAENERLREMAMHLDNENNKKGFVIKELREKLSDARSEVDRLEHIESELSLENLKLKNEVA